MSSRSKSRKLALDALYASELQQKSSLTVLEEIANEQSNRQNQKEIVGFARHLIEGVEANRPEIDAKIAAFSRSWSLERMPALDRAILRLGVQEISFDKSIPDDVAISEAVNLAKEYSTEESAAFVNGILAAISNTKTAL